MAKYNIYKIKKDKESNLSKNTNVGLSLAGRKSVSGFTLSFISQKNLRTLIFGGLIVRRLFGSNSKPKNKVYLEYFISNSSLSYAISMGKSHFYLKDFCDTDFGINLAERIADNNLKLKTQNCLAVRKAKQSYLIKKIASLNMIAENQSSMSKQKR